MVGRSLERDLSEGIWPFCHFTMTWLSHQRISEVVAAVCLFPASIQAVGRNLLQRPTSFIDPKPTVRGLQLPAHRPRQRPHLPAAEARRALRSCHDPEPQHNTGTPTVQPSALTSSISSSGACLQPAQRTKPEHPPNCSACLQAPRGIFWRP